MKCKTGYSFKTAVGHLPDVLSRLQEIDMGCAPIADRFSTFGFCRWTKLAEKAGLRPIYGVELGVTATMGAKKPTVDFWTFYAKNSLQPLHQLIQRATGQDNRIPLLTYSQALSAEGLIKISGERLLIDNVVEWRDNNPFADDPLEDYYFGLSPAIPKGLFTLAKSAGFKFIATSCNYYPREEDLEFYRVALGNRQSSTQTYPQHILSPEEWAKACGRIADDATLQQAAVHLTEAIDKCHAKLVKATLLTPEKPTTLRAMCLAGAARTNTDLTDPVYAERLDRELALIEEKKFEDYFYIIADLVTFAKKHMIVGPARGSSCGSLVCYLLDITTVDPIPYGLIFERFIDINRADLPDIDIDFSDAKRFMVFDYAIQKYGSQHVARLGTVGMFKPRSAMRQVGAQLRVPKWELDKVLDSVIERSSGDARALQTLDDALLGTDAGKALIEHSPEVLIASKMEGHPSNASQHAAGIVLTQEPIIDYVAVDERNGSVMCDKKDAEDYNLLKIDALGLTQLSVFERTLQLIGVEDKSGWLEKLPLNDPKAFEVLNQRHYSGIFQFNGPALQQLTNEVNIADLEDIVSITALARPGPLSTGGAHLWVERKNGRPFQYDHPVFEPYLKSTLGIVTFQEQVLQIGREVGDLTWGEVTELRKAISKSMGKEEFDKYGDKWKVGAAAKGVPEDIRNRFWDDMCSHGTYSFNRSHAVAYGIVSYYCCWLKAYHPAEFAAATMDSEPLAVRQISMLRELRDEGVGYQAIDEDRSIDLWNFMDRDGKRILVGPLSLIKGIGPATVTAILDARRDGTPLKPGILKKLKNAVTEIDTLDPIKDRTFEIQPDLSLPPTNIDRKPTDIADLEKGHFGKVLIIGIVTKINPKDENDPENVAKRHGRKLDGKSLSLGLWVRDDSGEIFCKISPDLFDVWGKEVIDRGNPGKVLYAILGTVPRNFRMITVTMIRHIGFMDKSISDHDGRRSTTKDFGDNAGVPMLGAMK